MVTATQCADCMRVHVDEPTVLHASSWQQFAKQANMNAYLTCNVNIFNENPQLLIIATLASITTQRKKTLLRQRPRVTSKRIPQTKPPVETIS